jgi:hypothetical protein
MIDASTADNSTLNTFYTVDVIDRGTTEVKPFLSRIDHRCQFGSHIYDITTVICAALNLSTALFLPAFHVTLQCTEKHSAASHACNAYNA